MALLLTLASLRADITLPTPAPPQADAATARVWRGGETAIELRGHYARSGALTFSIVRRPAHGKLSHLRLLGDHRARIDYAHDGSEPAAADGFSYVVQAEGRVSSPAEARIVVEEAPPRLRAPARIEFGDIMAGESETRPLTIRNEGGGVLEGRLTISSPWRLAWPDYRVATGETKAIAVAFQPNEAKKFVGQITLTDHAGETTIVTLTGTATAPVRLVPNPLQLPGLARQATVTLRNETNQAVKLEFEAGGKLKPIAPIELPAHEEKQLAVAVQPEVTGPVRESVTVIGSRFRLPLGVEAAGLPPPQTGEKRKEPVQAHRPPPPAAANSPLPTIPAAATTPAAPPAPKPVQRVVGDSFVQVNARRLSASRWELRWPAPKQSDVTYRIEERLLSLDSEGELETTWRELAASKIAAASDAVTTEIDRLNPRELHMLRVTALSADGAALWEAPLVALPPARAPSRRHEFWLLGLGCALTALLVLRWRANRAPA